MSELTQNIRQLLVTLLPASVLNDIACFVLYDEHPRDDRNIDITIYTKSGELREYYQRSLLASLPVDGVPGALKLSILRNSEGQLFYLLSADGQLVIISRRETLQIRQRLNNIERFEVNDLMCSGQSSLRIVKRDDAVPLCFDDKFESLQAPEMSETYTDYVDHDYFPLITHLKRKLTQAKYSVKSNEKSLKEFLDLRQKVEFSMCTNIHPNLDDSVIKGGLKMMVSELKLKFQAPWVKVCNKKLIIVFIAINDNNEPLQDVHILLHGTTGHSMVYTTKLFQKMDTPPFWRENESQTIPHNIETGIVVIMDLDEIKHNISNKIEFNGVIFYVKVGMECLLPIENVTVSAIDIMGKDFDALCSNNIDSNILLSIMAVSEKNDLILRHIMKNDDQESLGMDMFCRYLDMVRVPEADNILVHKTSPYHVLNGVMIMEHTEGIRQKHSLKVSVHSRSPSQVLALIHYIYDAVPITVIATTANYRITAKDDKFIDYNEEIKQNISYNHQNYAQSIIDRNKTVLEYIDNCMVKMNESKNPLVQSKIGTEVDLLAEGVDKYKEFRSKMLNKAAEGITKVLEEISCDNDTSTMVTD